MNKRLFAIALCLFGIALSAQAVSIKRYVRQGGTGRGLSWEEATGSIQAAVDGCRKAGAGTIYIAAGTYKEMVFLEYYTKDIAIRGSYPAAGGDSQDYKNNPTIIDGTNQMACLAMHGGRKHRTVLRRVVLVSGGPDSRYARHHRRRRALPLERLVLRPVQV